MTTAFVIAVGLGAGLASLLGFAIMARHMRQTYVHQASAAIIPETVILIEDDLVIDCTPDAPEMLRLETLQGVTWDMLHAAFVERFPKLPLTPKHNVSRYEAEDGTEASIQISAIGKQLRITLTATPQTAGLQHRLASDRAEASRLADAMNVAPTPIWQTNDGERVVWRNEAFNRLSELLGYNPDDENPFDLEYTEVKSARTVRTNVQAKDDSPPRWFEVTSRPVEGGWINFATGIDSLVEAEMAQRKFVQTLTKTFAHLPIGLAVFDRERRLVLFNPALVDLTRLPVDFLSSRPNLLSFFDHMRDNRMMPEPKNYANWRDQLAEVINAARDDRYCETWNLPSGLTYKITGRPHPDGAVAFLIEDISAEVSLTRQFRSELELTQSVIDCFGDAVAVFSQLGVLTFCNEAYRQLWKTDPDSAFAEMTVVDASADWQRACEPSPIWGELRDFILTVRDRAAWQADLVMIDGPPMTCMIEPVSAGATMVRFVLDDAATGRDKARLMLTAE